MAPPRRTASAIANYFSPTGAPKRKAEDIDGPEKENSPISSDEPQQKKSRSSSAKKPAKTSKAAIPKAKTGPSPKKLFNDTIKTITKEVKKMDKAVKNMDPNDKYGINIENYVHIATDHLKTVRELAEKDVALAWNLLLNLGDVAAPDLGRQFRLCGYGDHESGFAVLDQAAMELIEKMTVPQERAEKLPEVGGRWTIEDSECGEFKTGRANKQQRTFIANERIEWEEERMTARMERRMGCQDWVAVSLADLKGEKEYLDKYGVKGFFKESIAKLKGLDEGR